MTHSPQDDEGVPESALFNIVESGEGPQYGVNEVPIDASRKYLLIMVGLPARGKTFLAQKLCRYLAWHSKRSTVINLSRVWHEKMAAARHGMVPPVTAADVAAVYAAPAECGSDAAQAQDLYSSAMRHSAHSVNQFFNSGGVVAIVNDDFVTKAVRQRFEATVAHPDMMVIYVEVVRDSAQNAMYEDLKAGDRTLYGDKQASEEARSDFQQRVAALTKVYEPLDSSSKFFRMNHGGHFEVYGVKGYLPSKMASFLMNLSQNKIQCPIYFTRHGQSEFNVEDRLGGNPALTAKGRDDAEALGEFVFSVAEEERRQFATEDARGWAKHTRDEMQIWTSCLRRTIETARPAEEKCGVKGLHFRALNEIHAGICENLTYDDVKVQYPMIHTLRKQNKYAFRYPEGESYQDLVARLEPIILELENANSIVCVVAHRAVLRALLSYFGTCPAEHSVHNTVPHRTVWRCQYDSLGSCDVAEIKLPPPGTASPLSPTDGGETPEQLNEPDEQGLMRSMSVGL